VTAGFQFFFFCLAKAASAKQVYIFVAWTQRKILKENFKKVLTDDYVDGILVQTRAPRFFSLQSASFDSVLCKHDVH